MNAVSQWWIGGLRTRKAKVMSSILMGGSQSVFFGIVQKDLFKRNVISLSHEVSRCS